eukprot:TRINITY_DN10867_c0_g1_i1.p1 TRINITY_DN10867_c0_g1~~TRINITY_DN10867_c0_g1_i1.p1  ORF type:complete len:453 (-),score=83.51 TRINITY_DN10867_c0_g1_i1:127-1485(-)
MKRPYDGDDEYGYEDEEDAPPAKRHGGRKGGKGGGKSKSGNLFQVRRYAFKLLCTDALTANVIGHKGDTRKQIEDETGCSVWIGRRDDFYPASRFRILILHGDEENQVLDAAEAIVPKLMEVAEKEHDRDPGDPNERLLGKDEGEYIYRIAIPAFTRGKLIGDGGAKIQELRDETGARLFVENEVYEGHAAMRIIGDTERIKMALRGINELVQEEADSDEYPRWAMVRSFYHAEPPAARRYEEPRPRSRDRGEPAREHYGANHDRFPEDTRDTGRRGQRREDGRGAARPSHGEDPADILQSLPSEFPDGTLDMDHAIRCELPNERVGALIGRGRGYAQHVEKSTGATVEFKEGHTQEDGTRYRTILISGPLLSVYAAHMMLMKKYHDKDLEDQMRARDAGSGARANNGRAPRGGGGGGGSVDASDLHLQIAQLEEQLRDAKNNARGGAGGRR